MQRRRGARLLQERGQLLVKEKSVDLDMRMVEPGTLLLDDPFRVVQALWEDAPGLGDGSDAQAWRNWRRRVALPVLGDRRRPPPGRASLEMLVACERKQQTSLRARDILQRLEFFAPVHRGGLGLDSSCSPTRWATPTL